MFKVHQPWDPLKVCVVGRSYPAEFYQWIKNPKLRSLFERIAIETEEDYQGIIQTLQKFNVEIVRPNCPNQLDQGSLTQFNRVPGPISMNPRDQMIMIGERFFFYPFDYISIKTSGRAIDHARESAKEISQKAAMVSWWDPVIDRVKSEGNEIVDNVRDDKLNCFPANGITRCGKDIYFGFGTQSVDLQSQQQIAVKYFNEYRCHFVKTDGHIDGCFTPVKPGLIISIFDIQNYAQTFPGWEVVYLPGESWSKVQPFLDLKARNKGRWWIQGHEYDQDLIDFVETWLRDWTGYAEESVFDVNILVIDPTNVIVNGYNQRAFDAFARHGITAHVCPLRHRYFWDGGVHCVTLDLHREGQQQDWFPQRSQ